MIHLGILGAGAVVQGFHAPALKTLPDVKVAGVCDISGDTARKVGLMFDAPVFASAEELIKQSRCDAVLVALPTSLHREAVQLAAIEGKHIFCEKPMAPSVTDCQAMINVCKSAKVHLFIGHVVRFFHEYELARRLVAKGGVGKVGTARFERKGRFPRGARNWYADFSQSGGVIVDLMLHDIDFARWCFGEVERVYAKGLIERRIPEADHALVTLRHRSGVITHLEASWIYPGGFTTRFEIAGTQGVIAHRSDETRPIRLAMRHEQGREHPGVEFPASPVHRSPYAKELAHFFDCINGRAEPSVKPEDGREAIRIARAAISSIRHGEPVTLGQGEG